MPNSKRYSKHTCIYLASYFNNNYAKLLQHYLTKTLLMVMLYLLPEQRKNIFVLIVMNMEVTWRRYNSIFLSENSFCLS